VTQATKDEAQARPCSGPPGAGAEARAGAQEEVEEAEAKLSEAEEKHNQGAVRRFFAQFCTPVFLEALVLTFLGGARGRGPGSECCACHTLKYLP